MEIIFAPKRRQKFSTLQGVFVSEDNTIYSDCCENFKSSRLLINRYEIKCYRPCFKLILGVNLDLKISVFNKYHL
jgi:hypothetical protein